MYWLYHDSLNMILVFQLRRKQHKHAAHRSYYTYNRCAVQSGNISFSNLHRRTILENKDTIAETANGLIFNKTYVCQTTAFHFISNFRTAFAYQTLLYLSAQISTLFEAFVYESTYKYLLWQIFNAQVCKHRTSTQIRCDILLLFQTFCHKT